jgi:hypothetical protein
MEMRREIKRGTSQLLISNDLKNTKAQLGDPSGIFS